jgi:hypothetical protein
MSEDEQCEFLVVDLVTAAEVPGIGLTTAHEMVQTGRWRKLRRPAPDQAYYSQ